MKYIHFFLKHHFLHQVNVLAHLLCHVTYVTAFYKFFNLVVQPAKSIILNDMSKTIPKNARYPTAANVFIYFYLNDAYQIWLLKIECCIGLFSKLLV